MNNNNDSQSFKLLTRIANGALAGVVGTSIIYPLDFAKTRIQSQSNVDIKTSNSKPYKNMYEILINSLDVILRVSRNEGIKSLYKGLGVNLIFVMPEKVQESFYFFNSQKTLPISKELLAGCTAGFCQVVVTTPMEFLKIQLQMANKNINNNQNISASKLTFSLIKEKGIGVLYRGLRSTLLRDGLKENQTRIPFYHTLISGFIAGSVASFSVTPFDVIKTRIQYIKNDSNAVKYNGILDCAYKTLQNDSYRAFFKGAMARVAVISPLFGIAQTVYFLNITGYLFSLTKK